MKTKIKFITDTIGWDIGFTANIKSEDSENYYFDDVWGQHSFIEKNKTDVDFKIINKKMSKEPELVCGGKDVTYNALKKRAEELKNSR